MVTIDFTEPLNGIADLLKLRDDKRSNAQKEYDEAVAHFREDKNIGVRQLVDVGDQYPDRRQGIIDILCDYLRHKPEDDTTTEDIVLSALKPKLNQKEWAEKCDITIDLHDAVITENLDFDGVEIHDFNFKGAKFRGITFKGTISVPACFEGAQFDHVMFDHVTFISARFDNATFKDSTVVDAIKSQNIVLGSFTFSGVKFSSIEHKTGVSRDE